MRTIFFLWRLYSHWLRRLARRLARLKEANDDVYTAYLLKEQAIAFYEQKSKGEAENYLKKWASACITSGLKPFVRLGKRLLMHTKSILEYFVHKVSNGFAEGINNLRTRRSSSASTR